MFCDPTQPPYLLKLTANRQKKEIIPAGNVKDAQTPLISQEYHNQAPIVK